jgi:MYXO-CTERM domain-containing protein
MAAKETYTAVGFGVTGDGLTDSGTRRRLAGLVVDCVGASCSSVAHGQIDVTREWVGDRGTCEGDSGGPALDDENRVAGVTSRGGLGCTTPIYSDVYAWSAWIKQTAVEAAELGNYGVPSWAAVASGCSVQRADPTKPVPWFFGTAVGALALLRRRRSRSGPR